ncbi:MAG: multidrug efflux pump subunit AcrB [Saprospiraceae bacterium]|jgi:multidrug efflux pump subunit AcrB
MLKTLTHRPIGVLMTTLAVVIISIVFIRHISISLLPDIPIPKISVHINAPNLDARTLENTVTRTVRNQLLQVSDLRDIESRTRNGAAIVDLTLDYGINTSLSYIEINEKLDQIMTYLPRNLDRPRVIQTSISDIPVAYLNISSLDQELISHMELSEFARRVIRRRLEQLDEVAFVDIHGISEPEIIVRPKHTLLTSLNISESDLSSAILQANIELGNVLVKDRQYEYNIRLDNRLTTVEDIRNIIISINRKPYALKDLADIETKQQQRRGSFLINKDQGVSLAIRKKASANNFTLKDNLDDLIASCKMEYPNIAFTISNDQSAILASSFDSLKTSLLYGLGFAGIILFFFFKDWRLPFLILTIIPISLLLTLFAFYILGISINIISLTGLILGIGLMIDNSIIITESIKRHQNTKPLSDACAHGAGEVIRPLISSALTTSSVFLPLILLSGLAGALFYDQAISVSVALVSSLIVSYFVLPVVANLILKESVGNDNSKITPKESFHHKLIDFIITWRWIVIILFVLLLGLLVFYSNILPQQAFPKITRTSYSLDIDWNESISLAENEHRSQEIYDEMDSLIMESNSYLGELQFLIVEDDQNINEAVINLYFNTSPSTDILDKTRAFIVKHYPSSSSTLKPLPNAFDRILGSDPIEVYAHIQSIRDRSMIAPEESQILLSQFGGIGFEFTDPPKNTFIQLHVDHERLLIYDVNYNDLIDQLKSSFRANVITKLKTNDAFIPIQVNQSSNQDLRHILSTHKVKTRNGAQHPLNQFVTISNQEYYKTITAGRSGERLTLPIPTYKEESLEKISKHINESQKYTIQYAGPYFENLKIMKELIIIALLVLALLYLILAAQFESLIQPFIIALTLPIGCLGAVLALHITGTSLNIMSIVGIIILSGIDVNDAILKVDMFNRNRRDGIPLRQAIIDGSGRRLRAIIMTSLTTGLAMFPILFSSGLGGELQQPLAIALIGGLLFGTIASIVLIPAFYYILYNRSEKQKIASQVSS